MVVAWRRLRTRRSFRLANIRLGQNRRLDFREHRGYEGWERGIPTHVKAQYAGGMGFMSFGCGWDYGKKCRWETDVLVGFLPGAYSDRTHTTFTLRQNYIPWSIRCCERFAIEPFTTGVYLNLITGEDYWVRESDKYPGDSYYGFTSRLRTHLYVGQRFTYYLKNDSLLRHITLYYELSANDLDIVAKWREQVARLVRDRLFLGGDQVPVVAIDVPFRPGEGAETG